MLQSSYFVMVKQYDATTDYILHSWEPVSSYTERFWAKEVVVYTDSNNSADPEVVVLDRIAYGLPEGHWHQAGRVYNYYEAPIGSDCCIREAGYAEAREKTNQHQAEGK